MRLILGTTKDTPIETMRYMLDLPPIQVRQKLAQVKAYLNALENPKNPLHEAVSSQKGNRLQRGMSWMAEAEQSIQSVCQLTDLKSTREWEERPNEFNHLYRTLKPGNLGRHCREWPTGETNAEIQTIIEEHSKPEDVMIYTDGSVTARRAGWGFTAKRNGTTIYEARAAYPANTSSLTMEVEAVSQALQWVAQQCNTRQVIILTDSMNLLQKIDSGYGSPEWHKHMDSINSEQILWIYCPGHAGVQGNERADWLAGRAKVTDGLKLGRSDVIRNLRRHLQENYRHHTVDRLKERGIRQGSARWSTLRGKNRARMNQTNIGTVSRITLKRLLQDGLERLWAFPSGELDQP